MQSVKRTALPLLLLLLIAVLPISAFAESPVCEITSAQELCALSAVCTSDTASVGKIYRLCADIDLTGAAFSPIPVMNGVFDGCGHRITGLTLTGSGSSVALFRRVCSGGIVRDLSVCAEIAPDGSVYTAAGIVGRNDGLIADCRFDGSVVGDEEIGGVCAVNYGRIENCAAAGDVQGQHSTGGVCGVNYGQIAGARNQSNVNTTYRIVENATAVEIGTTLSTLTSLTQESMLDITDIGGVCGRNFGLITACRNAGNVGYDHVGYNVGGVCGRSSGILKSAENVGKVVGRRAVGGVCGKLEPSGAWNFSNEQTEKLREKMQLLRRTVYELTDTAEVTEDKLHLDTERLIENAKTASDIASVMSGMAEDSINRGAETLNELASRVSLSVSSFETIAESLSASASEMSEATRKFRLSLRALEKTEKDVDAAAGSIADAFDTLAALAEDNEKAAEKLKDACKSIRESAGDPAALQKAFAAFCDGFASFAAGADAFCKAAEALKDAEIPEEAGDAAKALAAWADFFTSLRTSVSAIADALGQLRHGFGDIAGSVDTLAGQFDAQKLSDALSSIVSAAQTLSKTLPLLSDLVSETQDAFGHLNHGSDYVYSAMAEADLGLGHLKTALGELKTAIDGAQSLCRTLDAKEELSVSAVDGDFAARRAALFSELGAMTAAADAVREDLHAGETFDQIKLLTETVYEIYDLFSEIAKNALTFDADRAYITDISAAQETAKDGSILLCKNGGAVTGDTNAGGIVGTVSPDTALDREGKYDVSALFSGTADYLIYAYIGQCENTGSITATKSAAGGIAGNMDYGMAAGCSAAGFVSASSENAGGIVGWSKGTVLACNARAVLDGASYVGGIAGHGNKVYSCTAIPTFTGFGAYYGSIAGAADGEVRDNRYVGELGGIDGISLHGACDAVESAAKAGVADRLFDAVTVTFRDGEGVDTVVTLPYGDYVTEYPHVADADGKRWVWTPYTAPLRGDVLIEGEYRRPTTVLASEGAHPQYLLEGEFGDGSQLFLTPYNVDLAGEILDAQTVTVTDAGEDLRLHLRAASGGKLYLIDADGKLCEHPYAIDGSYIKFDIRNGGSFVYAAAPRAFAVWIAAGAAPLIAALTLFLIFGRRQKKK